MTSNLQKRVKHLELMVIVILVLIFAITLVSLVVQILNRETINNLQEVDNNCPDCRCYSPSCDSNPKEPNVFFEFDHEAIRIFSPLGNLITSEDNSMRMGRGETQVLSFRLDYIAPILENKTILCIEYGNNLDEVELDTLPPIAPPRELVLSDVGNVLECYELPGVENYGAYEMLLFIKQDYEDTFPSTIKFHFLEEKDDR